MTEMYDGPHSTLSSEFLHVNLYLYHWCFVGEKSCVALLTCFCANVFVLKCISVVDNLKLLQ